MYSTGERCRLHKTGGIKTVEEMTVKQVEFPATLDPYVQQGRMFLFNAAQNLIQYGRVLTEAKPLVPRGQFENWVRLNFNMSERSAQGYMQVWKRFGSNAQLADVQFSNLQKMLDLSRQGRIQRTFTTMCTAKQNFVFCADVLSLLTSKAMNLGRPRFLPCWLFTIGMEGSTPNG